MRPWLLAVCATLATTAAAAPSAIGPQVSKVMARARNTQATYSVFNWGVISSKDGEEIGKWGAEFHSGSLHRVESGDERIVADCKKMTASYFDPREGRIIDDDKAARVACGVADLNPIRRGSYLGRSESRFGTVDRIRIEDRDTVRTYSIEKRGVIVAETINDANGRRAFSMETREIRNWVPKDSFTRESLSHSVVPDQFKSKQ